MFQMVNFGLVDFEVEFALLSFFFAKEKCSHRVESRPEPSFRRGKLILKRSSTRASQDQDRNPPQLIRQSRPAGGAHFSP